MRPTELVAVEMNAYLTRRSMCLKCVVLSHQQYVVYQVAADRRFDVSRRYDNLSATDGDARL